MGNIVPTIPRWNVTGTTGSAYSHVLLGVSSAMPIYVYERPDGSRFEIRQGFNDPRLTEDPETGVPVRRVLQPAPIIFKGSGWYKTDSRSTAAPKAEASATEKPAATDGAADKP